jgi:hypothetical protein
MGHISSRANGLWPGCWPVLRLTTLEEESPGWSLRWLTSDRSNVPSNKRAGARQRRLARQGPKSRVYTCGRRSPSVSPASQAERRRFESGRPLSGSASLASTSIEAVRFDGKFPASPVTNGPCRPSGCRRSPSRSRCCSTWNSHHVRAMPDLAQVSTPYGTSRSTERSAAPHRSARLRTSRGGRR